MTYRAQGVGVTIGGATLLEGVSIDVAPGEIVAVAGPNGAGKSTALRTLAGDLQPSSGTVTLGDRNVRDWSSAQLAHRRAVMSTEQAVAFAFTAREVAMMGRMPLHGGDPDDVDVAVIEELLAAVDCTDLADRVFATLSTGERQRVSLARAVAQVTDTPGEEGLERYLLLDEPTSSLDPAHQHTAMRLIRRTADAGRGVLAIVHDLNLAAAYADRVVLMHDARVVETGTPAEVLRADLLASVFDIPMLVIPHPQLSHPLVIAEPHEG
ncbi:MAG: heme ABC transporter ATP-binding protein [Candidatus Limnocylindrales bacterium]